MCMTAHAKRQRRIDAARDNLLSESLADHFLQLFLGLIADALVNDLAILEQDQRGDTQLADVDAERIQQLAAHAIAAVGILHDDVPPCVLMAGYVVKVGSTNSLSQPCG